MTAQSYSETRSQLARSLGLGQQRRKGETQAAAEQVAKAPKRGRGRPKASAGE